MCEMLVGGLGILVATVIWFIVLTNIMYIGQRNINIVVFMVTLFLPLVLFIPVLGVISPVICR